jgi:hypothetical protein
MGRTVTRPFAVLVFEPHQDFGRGADDVEIPEVEIEHVGRGVQRAQRAVERQRARREGLAHALREHHLHDVAIDDVLLGAAHRGLECLLAEFRYRGGGLARAHPAESPPARAAWPAVP